MVFLQGRGRLHLARRAHLQEVRRRRDRAWSRTSRTGWPREVWGIGFKTADTIARAVGIPHDSARADQGRRCSTRSRRRPTPGTATCPSPNLVADAVADPRCRANSWAVHWPEAARRASETSSRDAVPTRRRRGPRACTSLPFHRAERCLAGGLLALLHAQEDRLAGFARRRLGQGARAGCAQRGGAELAPEQEQAVRLALTAKVAVLTGGPGCGKSFTVTSIVALAAAKKAKIVLAAPTGRAAKRLAELTGHEAAHRAPAAAAAAGRRRRLRPRQPARRRPGRGRRDVDARRDPRQQAGQGGSRPARTCCSSATSTSSRRVGAGEVLRDLLAAARSRAYGSPRSSGRPRSPGWWSTPTGSTPASPPHVERVSRLLPVRLRGRPSSPPSWSSTSSPAASRASSASTRAGRPGPRPDAPRAGRRGQPQRPACRRRSPRTATAGPERRHGGRVFRVGDKVIQIRNNYDKGAAGVFNGTVGVSPACRPGGADADRPHRRGRGRRLRLRRAGRARPRVRRHRAPLTGQRVPGRGHPGDHELVDDAAAQPALHGGHPGQEARRAGRLPQALAVAVRTAGTGTPPHGPHPSARAAVGPGGFAAGGPDPLGFQPSSAGARIPVRRLALLAGAGSIGSIGFSPFAVG